jgi:hypothetical protein
MTMRTANSRLQRSTARSTATVALAASLALAGLYSACSYDQLQAGIVVTVHNIPLTADHLEVVLNDSGVGSLTRSPAFGIGSLTDLEVVFPPIVTNGTVTIKATAKDHDQSELATVTITGSYQGTLLPLEATLVPQTGFVGTFGAPCGNNGTCGTGLACQKYTTTDTGVCTQTCASASACATGPAGASCQTFKGSTGQTFCQWECDNADGGANLPCPTGLACGAQVPGGKKFCQGAP